MLIYKEMSEKAISCRSLSSRELTISRPIFYIIEIMYISESWSTSFLVTGMKKFPVYGGKATSTKWLSHHSLGQRRIETTCTPDNILYKNRRSVVSGRTACPPRSDHIWYKIDYSNKLEVSFYKCLGCLRIWMTLLLHLMQYLLDRLQMSQRSP